jgi:hypothetical protein
VVSVAAGSAWAAGSLTPPGLLAPQFSGATKIVATTHSPGAGTGTVMSLPSRRIVRTGRDTKIVSGLVWIHFAALHVGDYRLCVTQAAQKTYDISYAGSTKCTNQQLAHGYYGYLQYSRGQNSPMFGWLTAARRVTLSFGLEDVTSSGRACGVYPSRTIFTSSSHAGTFDASFRYENLILVRAGIKHARVFHDRLFMVGTVSKRHLSGTISSRGPDCNDWAVKFNLRANGLSGVFDYH